MTGEILNAKVYKKEKKILNLKSEGKMKEEKALFITLRNKKFSVN